MQVQVKLFSRFREHLPPEARGEATIKLPDGATIEDLIEGALLHEVFLCRGYVRGVRTLKIAEG